MKASKLFISAFAAFSLMSATASAQDYFWFDDGGVITPEDGATVSELSQFVINYTGVAGTADGLNPYNGVGEGWITSDNGTYNVKFMDDYNNHKLTITVDGNPIVKAGDYKLTIPEGKFNVYGNASLINDAVSYWYTVDGSKDLGGPESVELVSSYPADGQVLEMPVEALTLTFDQDVTVSHSSFDAAGRITNLTSGGYIQLNFKAEGNVVTLTKGLYSSSDFMAGQSYELEIYADHIKSAANPAVTFGKTTIAFSIKAEGDADAIKVMAQIPAAGENIHNAGSVTFNKNVTKVNKDKVSLVNEYGHVAPLSSVGRDGEASKNIIFNIAPDTYLQGGTTYKLHLEAGAVEFGTETNEEMDAAYWCIPVEKFALISEMANSTVAHFQEFSFVGDVFSMNLQFDKIDEIKVTGVAENASYTYAEQSSIGLTDGNHVTVVFDRDITPALLAEGGALYNSVKVVLPEGLFTDNDGRISRHTEFIVYVIAQEEVGEATWTFNPEDGAQVESIGIPFRAENEDGSYTTTYSISFSVSGDHVYARIPDGSKLYIKNLMDGSMVRTFSRYDVMGWNNQFELEIGEEAITTDGIYQLVIPADAVYLYADAGCQTEPIHPEEDVTATWYIGEVTSLDAMRQPAQATRCYDLMGRQLQHATGLCIEGGKLIIK